MKLRLFLLAVMFLPFLSAACLGGSGDDAEATPHEPPENAMSEETKAEFDQLMEEYKKTGQMPQRLSEISSEPEETSPTEEDNTTSN